MAKLTSKDIGYPDLKQKRAMTPVEVPLGQTLDYYVPFYFGTRSPMLFAYKSGRVTGKNEDQDDIVYFATTVEDIAASGAAFAFTDGHPIREPKAFYNDLSQLGQVDLALMTQTYWFDTDADPDRRRRRQAEFLVWEQVPLGLLRCVAARSQQVRHDVEELLAENSIDLPCLHKPNWYYN
jgi:hypothetical protein